MDIEREGAVLLKNENETLPLAKDVNKVNVFGWASTQWLGGGSGSGQIISTDETILTALKIMELNIMKNWKNVSGFLW
mgnify:CR=1 FL=1